MQDLTPYIIRVATNLDREAVCDIHLRAFPEGENRIVAALATQLLDEEAAPDTIVLVAESGGEVVGHIAFSPVKAESDKDWRGSILAPLAVNPVCQKTGIGSKLIASGIELLARKMVHVLFVYGDPKYYGRFGFNAEAAGRFLPPYELEHPFGWQAKVLHEGGTQQSQAVQLSCVAPLCDPALW